MAWTSVITTSYGALTESEQEGNVDAFASYFNDYMTLEAMAGICGNMQRESQLNPGQQEGGHGGSLNYGYGLIQWTPGSTLVNWCEARGLTWSDGNAQCYRIKCEGEAIEGAGGTWLPTSDYSYSWSEFCQLTDSAEACKAYLAERERAGVSALEERLEYTAKWAEYLGAHPPVGRKIPIWILGSRLRFIIGNV